MRNQNLAQEVRGEHPLKRKVVNRWLAVSERRQVGKIRNTFRVFVPNPVGALLVGALRWAGARPAPTVPETDGLRILRWVRYIGWMGFHFHVVHPPALVVSEMCVGPTVSSQQRRIHAPQVEGHAKSALHGSA